MTGKGADAELSFARRLFYKKERREIKKKVTCDATRMTTPHGSRNLLGSVCRWFVVRVSFLNKNITPILDENRCFPFLFSCLNLV